MTKKLPWRTTRIPIRGQSWRERAACAGSTDRAFITPRHELKVGDWERARAVCLACPVIRECWDHHSRDGDFEGIAGGQAWEAPRKVRTDRPLAGRPA